MDTSVVGAIVMDFDNLPGRVVEQNGDQLLIAWRDSDPEWVAEAEIWHTDCPTFISWKEFDNLDVLIYDRRFN